MRQSSVPLDSLLIGFEVLAVLEEFASFTRTQNDVIIFVLRVVEERVLGLVGFLVWLEISEELKHFVEVDLHILNLVITIPLTDLVLGPIIVLLLNFINLGRF